MGLTNIVKKCFNKILKSPEKVSSLLAASSCFYVFFDVYNELIKDNSFEKIRSLEDAVHYFFFLISPTFVYACSYVPLLFLRSFFYKSEQTKNPIFKDIKKMRNKIKEIKKESPEFETYEKEESSREIIKPKIDWPSFLLAVFLADVGFGDKLVYKSAVKTQNPEMLITAMNEYLIKEKYDSAFICLRDALTLIGDKKLKTSFSLSLIRQWANFCNLIDRYNEPFNIGFYFMNAGYNSFKKDKSCSWHWSKTGKELSKEFNSPFKKEAYILHAMLSSTLKTKDAKNMWADAIKVVQEDPVWERLGESRSVVRVLKNSKFLEKSIIFKQNKNLDELINEAETTIIISNILKEEAVVPQVLYISENTNENETDFLVMRYLEGASLLSLLEKNKKDSILDIISVLAKIHAGFPENKVKKGKLSIPFYLKSRLTNKNLDFSRDFIWDFIGSYRPVYECFKNEKVLWGYNKDAHPENWIINKKNIGIIDCENNYLIPVQFDLVNLLEYGDFFNKNEKTKYITHYLTCIKKEGKTSDDKTFLLGYWNAVIHRVIGLVSAWSSPLRPSLHDKRKNILKHAIDAVETIKKDHTDYYTKYKKEYKTLENNLLTIEKKIV